ncbi:transferase [Streptomyces catenulae]|uniref:Transferase n=1 Tax=Streptomyces catenulae TaxID=66875 RepID=A0ABV2YS61_9ACTN|nr:transferase [Streptomyces catenulae]
MVESTYAVRAGSAGYGAKGAYEVAARLRRWARLFLAGAVVAGYVALHLALNAGADLRDLDRFRDVPARAAAFTAALDRAGGAAPPAGVRAGAAWFREHAPAGRSRSTVLAAADAAGAGRFPEARARVAGLAAEVRRERAERSAAAADSGAATLWWAVPAVVLLVPALWLRRRRRAGAAEVVAVVDRFAPRHPWWRRPVYLVACGVGYTLFAVGALSVQTAQQQGYKMPLTAQLVLLCAGLAALGAGVLILRHARPRAVRGAAGALRADGRRPVLYLRSFADDADAAEVDDGAFVNLHSREEQLAGALGAVGPVITVGRPGEPLPRLGAARFYLPLDDWRPAILQLMELSRLIVLRLGPGDGLWWEVERARATQPPEKLVLLAGDHPGTTARLDARLPVPSGLDAVVPADPWTTAVVVFGPGWTPRVHPVGPASDTRPRRGFLARNAAGVLRALRGTSVALTPTHHLARTLQTALDSTGVRARRMAWRATLATQAALGRGAALVTALGLLAWLGYRALRLLGG